MHRQVHDSVYACMETGNHGQARTIMTEYKHLYPEKGEALYMRVVADYGVSL